MNRIETFPLVGVAIGPGDPELITVKALKALQNCDVVYFAASKIEGDKIQSFSKGIINSYDLKAACKPLLFPMSGKNRDAFYQDAYEILRSDVQAGLKVCMVTEGDLSFYSTFGYLLKLAKADSLAVEAIPGVPAFIAGGAKSEMPIVDGNYSFVNIARPDSFDEISKELQSNKAVVVMKMKVLKGWYNYLKDVNRAFVYVEKVGTAEEFITSDFNDLADRTIPYFALIIFPAFE